MFVRFPQDQSGRLRKLCRPWHGPYRIVQKEDPDITAVKVYHPQHGEIRVHQSRVCKCPVNFPAVNFPAVNFPARYYWYGGRNKGPGRPPKWVDKFLNSPQPTQQASDGSGSDAIESLAGKTCLQEGIGVPTDVAESDGYPGLSGAVTSPDEMLINSDEAPFSSGRAADDTLSYSDDGAPVTQDLLPLGRSVQQSG